MGGSEMTIDESGGPGWPINDIGGLARHVPEVDPRQYFDEQARLAYEDALVKWPVLARLMGLVDESGEPQTSEQGTRSTEMPLPSASAR
ncbi:hypothetical protein [Trinickia dinghuensis]|uniref:hypothetical protein n=1 Tax=Trinickia dinghuensis TaxID=2291023 RepID=UPI001FE4DBF7|nr:hypothetical protein [Trinickia dinghuensis]